MSKNIFVYVEQRDGIAQNVAFELIGIAKELAQVSGGEVCGVLCGSDVENAAKEVIAYGADKVYVVECDCLAKYSTEPYAQAVTAIVKKYEPNAFLLGATSIGRDLAPRLSARIHTGLTADCTKLEMDADGNLFMTRPAFGGNLFATIACPDHRPQMSTVRPGVMKKLPKDESRKGEIIVEKVDFDKSKFAINIIDEIKETREIAKIEDAKILVSMGRGMANHKEEVEDFAKKVGGTVSCSRAIVDTGILPSERQVGQTGKTVRPDLYLALGISGAVQHLAGMSDSEYIVAINKDAGASIFSVAHLGVVGDAAKILPYLEKEILARKK